MIGSALQVAAALRDWADRASALIPPEDRKVLLSPARLFRAFAKFAFLHRGDRVFAGDINARDPEIIHLFLDLFRIAGTHYFRTHTLGVENVPPSGPVLLVGNHNGGLVSIDSFLAGVAIADAHGAHRAPYALGHDVLFDDPVVRRYAAKIGILRAGHQSAELALRAGHTVLVYPGSDWDAFRPYRDRNKVVLAGRKGFIKLALRERVPIVPVLSAGSHEQFVVLTRGETLAKVTLTHRLARTDVFPIVLSFPWGITTGFLPYIPFPSQITIGFGEPIQFDGGPAAAENPQKLEECYQIVERRMQNELNAVVQVRNSLRTQGAPSPQTQAAF
ncbi:MAG: acyltransferase family protein [Polyangiaceae bacterium]|nr:acyltransferase family protein [Polyangiaceae bacterium]